MGMDRNDGVKNIRKAHRKLYYVPGMISLLALPIICYFYLKPLIREERNFEIIVMADYKPEKRTSYQFGRPVSPIRYDSAVLSLPEVRRKFTKVLLNGNEDTDYAKLDSFRIRIRKMKEDNDSVNGVHLILGNSTTYGVFIRAINICNQEDIVRYFIYKNNIWVSHVKPSKGHLERLKKRREEREKFNKEDMLTKIADSKYSFRYGLKSAIKVWPFLVILGVLAYVSIRRTTRG